MLRFADDFLKRSKPHKLLWILAAALCFLPLAAQSNRTTILVSGGTWHLHSRIPLGAEALLLQPAHQVVQMMASVDCPALDGWTLSVDNAKPILLDKSGKPAKQLPSAISFRVTAQALDKSLVDNPMPLDDAKSLNDFLLDLRFRVQIFRGMKMRVIEPNRTWMIGVPADEASDERIYGTSFRLDDVRADDRIVLLVTDRSGFRLTKFHLEFL